MEKADYQRVYRFLDFSKAALRTPCEVLVLKAYPWGGYSDV